MKAYFLGGIALLSVLLAVRFAWEHHHPVPLQQLPDVRDTYHVELLEVPASTAYLASWRSAEASDCRTAPVSVYVLGTSRSIVDRTVSLVDPGVTGLASTFQNRWTNQLAKALTRICPSLGSGMVGLRWGTGVFTKQGLNADYFTVPANVQIRPYLRSQVGPTQNSYGPRGELFGSDSMTVEFTASSIHPVDFRYSGSFDRLRMYCVSGPDLHAFTMQIDGKDVGVCGGYAPVAHATIGESARVANGPHSAGFSCRIAPCAAAYIEAVEGTVGISVSNLSVGGASAEIYGEFPNSQFAYADLNPGKLKLVIIEEGCNEPGEGDTPKLFRTALRNLIAHFRAEQSHPAILLIADMQDGLAHQEPFYSVLEQVAVDEHTGFVDMRKLYPSPPPGMFGPDKIHESDAGEFAIYRSVSRVLLPARRR